MTGIEFFAPGYKSARAGADCHSWSGTAQCSVAWRSAEVGLRAGSGQLLLRVTSTLTTAASTCLCTLNYIEKKFEKILWHIGLPSTTARTEVFQSIKIQIEGESHEHHMNLNDTWGGDGVSEGQGLITEVRGGELWRLPAVCYRPGDSVSSVCLGSREDH